MGDGAGKDSRNETDWSKKFQLHVNTYVFILLDVLTLLTAPGRLGNIWNRFVHHSIR
jgi:hypothetical protein